MPDAAAPPAAAPLVPVGIDLGSLHARLAVIDADGTVGVVSNTQGSRYTLAASTVDESHDGMASADEGGGGRSRDSGEDAGGDGAAVQFVFGEAARRTLVRGKRPLGRSLVRHLSTVSVCGSVDWSDDDELDDEDGGDDEQPNKGQAEQKKGEAPEEEEEEEDARTKSAAALASSAFFANLASLACDATSSKPSCLRAVVSVPAGADARMIRGVVKSAKRGLDGAAEEAQEAERKAAASAAGGGKKKKKKKGKKEEVARIVGVLTDPAAVCVAHGLTDEASPSSNVITLGGGDDADKTNGSPSNDAPPNQWRHALILDWGASGLTLTHMTRLGSSNILAIVDTQTDPSLSGNSLTNLLVQHCASLFERRARVTGVLDSVKARARLEAACEVAIRTLGRATSCHVTVDGLYEGMDLNVPVSRPRFDMLCGPALRKAGGMVGQFKEKLGAADGDDTINGGRKPAATDFDVVLLAGNVALMPSVGAMVDRSFPSEGGGGSAARKPWRGRADAPPDEAVAMGCARHAAVLLDPSRPTPASIESKAYLQPAERAPLSPVAVGVCTWDDGGRSCPPFALIEVDTPLPACVRRTVNLGSIEGRDGGDCATLGIIQMGKQQEDGCEEKLLGRINDILPDAETVELTVELSREGKLIVSVDGGEGVSI